MTTEIDKAALLAAHLAPAMTARIVKYLNARKFADSTREQIDARNAPILARYSFRDEAGEEIKTNEELYLCEGREEDFTAYYAELDALTAAAGYNLPAGYCPALVARNGADAARKELLEASLKVMGLEGKAHLMTMKSEDKWIGHILSLHQGICKGSTAALAAIAGSSNY